MCLKSSMPMVFSSALSLAAFVLIVVVTQVFKLLFTFTL